MIKMSIYKPCTIEENYCNVKHLKDSFWHSINSFAWEYNFIFRKYNDTYYYNQLLASGLINPYLSNFEDDMCHLAYRIFGFTSCTFETLSYALDVWRINTDAKLKNRNVTDKQYNQAIDFLCQKCKSIKDESVLLAFRTQRNYTTHYGRIYFCDYVFKHGVQLYSLIETITYLLEQMNLDLAKVRFFLEQQTAFIEDMNNVLSNYNQVNCIIA